MPIPTHLINASLEKAVLGKLLSEPEHIGSSSDVSPEIFTISQHKLIFDTIRRLYTAGSPVSPLTVGSDLHNRGVLESIGGVTEGILPLIEFKAQAYDLDFSLTQLANLNTMRRTLSDLYQFVGKLETAGSTVDDIRQLEVIAQNADSSAGKRVRLRRISEVVSEYPGGLNSFLSPLQGQNFIRFPWVKAQDRIGGIWPGEVMILGGRPGSGKSAAALQVARFNSQFGSVPAIYNLEMTDAQTIYRTICARAKVSMARFRTGHVSEMERKAIYAELRTLAGENVLLCDKPNLTIGEIRASLKHSVRTQGVDMAIIDYLQLAEPGIKTDNRQQEVSYVSRQCKLMAMECKIPIIVLAQLSRRNEEQNREPALSDLRESGSIEQDADVVMFTYRKTETSANGPRDSCKLLFKKARNGPDGACGVYWDAQALEFRDLESEREE